MAADDELVGREGCTVGSALGSRVAVDLEEVVPGHNGGTGHGRQAGQCFDG